MQRELDRRVRGFLITAAFLAILCLIYLTAEDRPQVSKLEEAITEALAPVSQFFYRTSSALSSAWRQVVLWSKLDEENRAFREKIGELEAEIVRLEEYRLENQRLRTLLNFQERNKEQLELLPAQVIGRDPSNWLSTITIDQGLDAGVKKDQAVITASGIVGVVRSATKNTANVLLLSDARMAIGGLVRSTRHLVLVEGKADKPGYCSVRGLTADVTLRKGDLSISSGLGGIFPKGLLIGEITEVEQGKYGLGFQGLLRPAVDLGKLEEVFVVKNFQAPPLEEESEQQ